MKRYFDRSTVPILIMALSMLFLSFTLAQAQDSRPANQPLTVGIYVSPPFVMKDGDRYTGMAIDLWEAAAGRLALDYTYAEYPTFEALINATSTGEVKAAVSNLTITKERVEQVTFSQPWYDAGLRIMVAGQEDAGFWQVIGGLETAGHLRAMAWLIFIVVLATIIMTLVYRRFDGQFPSRWHEGLAESFYEVMSVATSGKVTRTNPFGWLGRISGGIWMLCGVAVIAYVTSSVTSVMTALTLTHQINSIGDLPGRNVGVLAGSVGENYANDLRLATRPYPSLDSAVDALVGNEVTAIVGDAPVLEHYAHTHPDRQLTVVGAIFHPDKYGFGFRQGDPFSHTVTLQILDFQESGELETLRRKYFGSQ